MTGDTEAIIAATALGPIAAVCITLAYSFWREWAAAKAKSDDQLFQRRLDIFRILMATRAIPISNDHVNALNLIEVDFYGCSDVEQEWKVYKNHLNTGPEDDLWRRKKEKLLAQLPFEIGKLLKFAIPAMEIFEGGCSPKGWTFRELRSTGALEYLHELREGTKTLPPWICGMTPPADSPSVPSKNPPLPTSKS